MKVLIVDDEELIRNIIKEDCHNEGYLTGIEHTGTDEDTYEIDFEVFDNQYLTCYKLIDDVLVLDEEKARKLDNTPSWDETVDAQLAYTAMMTDTLLNE